MIKEILLLCLYLIGFVYFYLNIRKGYLEMDPCDYIYCEGWERIFETLIAGVFWPVWFPISLIILIAIKIIYYCDKIKPPKWLILICLISFISCDNKKEIYSIYFKIKDPISNNMCYFITNNLEQFSDSCNFYYVEDKIDPITHKNLTR